MKLGYAPEYTGALKDHLLKKGISTEVAESIHLIKNSAYKDRTDYFNNYVIFPVLYGHDTMTFTGRSLNSDFLCVINNSPNRPRERSWTPRIMSMTPMRRSAV